jgi:hypothetical protein
MAETGLTRQRILSELSKSPHGSLKEYLPIGKQAVLQEGEFYQHMLSWDRTHGQIRDSKVALPVIGLAFEKDEELLDNSFAHIALLGPRELARAYRFRIGDSSSWQDASVAQACGRPTCTKRSRTRAGTIWQSNTGER